MFNLLFADALETVIVLNQSAYWGRSEHLFATALGVESHFFWSVPDQAVPSWQLPAHQSDWKFDFASEPGIAREPARQPLVPRPVGRSQDR